MKWYIAKIVFHININHGEHHSQFDESVRLIEAESMNDAFHKARSIGKKEEVEFVNKMNELVEWKFIDVSDVYQLEELKHGSEVHSSTLVDYRSADYISMVRHKAQILRDKAIILS